MDCALFEVSVSSFQIEMRETIYILRTFWYKLITAQSSACIPT